MKLFKRLRDFILDDNLKYPLGAVVEAKKF